MYPVQWSANGSANDPTKKTIYTRDVVICPKNHGQHAWRPYMQITIAPLCWLFTILQCFTQTVDFQLFLIEIHLILLTVLGARRKKILEVKKSELLFNESRMEIQRTDKASGYLSFFMRAFKSPWSEVSLFVSTSVPLSIRTDGLNNYVSGTPNNTYSRFPRTSTSIKL